MMRAGAMAGAALLAAGCAGGESSGVVALGPDVFVIENRGGILPGVVERSLEQAAAFCAGQGAQAEMLTTRVNPQSYQLAFRCSGRPGMVPMAVAQAPGQPPTAARSRAVVEPGQARRRGRVVSAPDWAAQPQDMPAFVTAQPAMAMPMAAQPVQGWSGGNPFAAQPPAGVPWASAQQAAPFGTAIPASVFTPPPMPVIAPAPEGTTRRMRGSRAAAREADRAYEGPAMAQPVAMAPVPMAVPMGVPLAPAMQPMPMAQPVPVQQQPVFAAPPPAAALPAPNQIPGLGLLPPQGQAPVQPMAMQMAPMQVAPRAAALAPVAGPVFQPSVNPLPPANAPLATTPPASFWQIGR